MSLSRWHFHVVRIDQDGRRHVYSERIQRRRPAWQFIARQARSLPDSTWAVRRCDCRIGGL